ncbi:D-TA family PLP-dependent enzyme [Clostridiales bacterium COT073_COT-073]|nr:D-TA family PLP-dependent enzyme [Clostridiales bacterium COT073_COT-073]
MNNHYMFEESKDLVTPALIYYPDIIRNNIEKTINLAGGPQHLWPHVKTHKMSEMIHLQMSAGITRFKCATIAEAQMVASCGAEHVLVAYPLVGPNINRFFKLTQSYPKVQFWAIGDCTEQIRILGQVFKKESLNARVLVDVDLGMNRTGVPVSDVEYFYEQWASLEGIEMRGLHCYDGHRTEHNFDERKQKTDLSAIEIKNICTNLQQKGYTCDTLVLGGTPSMPCYTDFQPDGCNVFLSPGTCFVNDYGYSKKYPDLVFTPGAAVLTRVISCPGKGHFTLDLGYKGIASDPEGTRGIIAGMEHVQDLFQSEEHWAFCMEPGYEDQCPRVGDELFVIPTHICPTSALYPSVPIVEQKHLTGNWEVTARNRCITI